MCIKNEHSANFFMIRFFLTRLITRVARDYAAVYSEEILLPFVLTGKCIILSRSKKLFFQNSVLSSNIVSVLIDERPVERLFTGSTYSHCTENRLTVRRSTRFLKIKVLSILGLKSERLAQHAVSDVVGLNLNKTVLLGWRIQSLPSYSLRYQNL